MINDEGADVHKFLKACSVAIRNHGRLNLLDLVLTKVYFGDLVSATL